MINPYTNASILMDRAADDARYEYKMTSSRLALIVVGAIFTLIGTISVVLRFVTAAVRSRPVGKDDWFMLLAWLSSIGFTAASYVSVAWGVGFEKGDAPDWWALEAIKAVYVIEIFYYFSLFFVKVSILMLYLRLAGSLRTFLYWGAIGTLVIIVAQFVSTVVVVGVQCLPMSTYWDPTVEGTCININDFFYSTNIFTIITDIMIIGLPIATLWKLNCPRAQKYGIMLAFLLGGISTIASCIRMYSIQIFTESPERMRDAAPINTWSFIEINLGILCCSAPAIKPLFFRSQRDRSAAAIAAAEAASDEKRGSGGFNRRLRKKDDLLTETTTEVDLESRIRPEHHHHQLPQPQQQNQSVMAPLQSVHTATSSSRRGSRFEPWNLSGGEQPRSCYISAERRMRQEGSVESFGSQQILVQTTVDVDEKSVDDWRRRRESEADK
ncbi:hypothetical protein KC327_g16593 [Hortaea werneckii]|uniref:Rhodopsin domain-containing protein n=1 Tax=Hortaea werneckii EXF-2000 TaxID=1157616 RepID=A0A1Z5T9C0_HORWE|nr:hypothetical protein KC358_g16619 [Hortaea werneckii]OTA32614.1 hypothetical protein BTJ68_07888 [Hortaea werneckii EXF-2000]KAI6798491.1 hypothetical protein KC350_g16334 [Hortaea werneckii]KAI6900974.1 hypothetical protein KC348_g16625 [Hortaea werneckii]KAI6920597.1 hypothetical protein KC341_g16516 [Hortaea werneckii]